MKPTKIFGITGLMILLIIIPTINAVAISSWPVQKDDELNFTLSYRYYNENNTLIEDTSASISVVIKKIDNNLTYDVSCDPTVKVGDWGNKLKSRVEGSNLTSRADGLYLMPFVTPIIYEASVFANMENEWASSINFTKNFFWADAFTFTTYSADEITNMDFSSSYNANGYEITASWDDYKNLDAGSLYSKYEYSNDGILLKREYSRHWVENWGYEWSIENVKIKKIPSFPLVIFGFCSLLGITAILLKKR